MDRLKKLLWMILIFWIVFFIICDEKWYKIWFENNQIVFNEIEKKTYSVEVKFDPNAVYKNSDLIHLNYEFENKNVLRKSDGMDPKYVAKLEQEKRLEKESLKNENKEKIYTWSSIVALGGDDIISSMFQWTNDKIKTGVVKNDDLDDNWNKQEEKSENEVLYKKSHRIQIYSWFENPIIMRKWVGVVENLVAIWDSQNDNNNEVEWVWLWEENFGSETTEKSENEVLYKKSHRIQIYSWFENPITMRKWIGVEENLVTIWDSQSDNNEVEWIWLWEKNFETNVTELSDTKITDDLESLKIDSWNSDNTDIELSENNNTKYKVEEYKYQTHNTNIRQFVRIENSGQNIDIQEDHLNNSKSNYTWENGIIQKETFVKIKKYQLKKHELKLRNWVVIKNNFNINDEKLTLNWLTDPMLQSLLEDEEIDLNTIESANDEFLQKVFEKTKDNDVMNLIIETYLNEYQFVKAKKFIENLSDEHLNELNPLLNLRVEFNSFPLGSSEIYKNLESSIQNYSSNNKISDEDKNRYLWILALMNQNYDKFFEIAKSFGSEKNKTFALKIQWYKDQISKQMWMPEYYFDTLVSLELFNQWLFQPAKVLALHSLQQNVNYILPYQVLAYANFLTNSRDTSTEYLKKLVDLDSNNAEKYRFLMWVASYRNEKYEQSVVMLSMIKDENLRLDAQRYLINNYLKLDQKNKLIASWNKLLWSENLVASDFYTYFYEAFFHPYSEWKDFQLYAYDTELANKMLRACSTLLQDEEKAVCTYGGIGRNIALWQFDWIEQYLLDLVSEYPQWYLYQALWDYFVQQWDLEKAKLYLLKAVSLTQKTSQRIQIKKLLEDVM